MNILQMLVHNISTFFNSFNQPASTSVSLAPLFIPLFATTEDSIVEDVLPTSRPFGLFGQLFLGRNIFNTSGQIFSVNGNPIEDNQAITLPSGAILNVDSQTGAFIYNPNSAIDAQSGAPVVETFTYTYLGFFGIPITLNARVVVFDTQGSNNGGDPSDPTDLEAPPYSLNSVMNLI
jgi:hypothetical protein